MGRINSLREAQILIEQWRTHYNTKRPHSALGYRPPVPETICPDGPKARHALTFKMDHSGGADHALWITWHAGENLPKIRDENLDSRATKGNEMRADKPLVGI